MINIVKKIIYLSFILLIVACSPSNDIKVWIEETNIKYKIKNVKIKDHKDHNIKLFEYAMPKLILLSPFNKLRLFLTNAPDLDRQKEVLEEFDLNELNYLGYYKKENKITAYIKANNIVYSVSEGNHLGLNRGKVVKITPEAIILEELVENNLGEWVNKENKLDFGLDKNK